ncbi:MAG: glycosyltransferase family 2 protein [Candidatus Methanoperedens sp.]|nr:glycosyltransferase family 2 protein [Candidatus Methanoperedens sp.]
MKASIIIPTLNEEKGIEKTINDIKSLDENYEIIVVDGLSTDNTREIALSQELYNNKEFGLLPFKNNVKVISEERKGKGIAMKTGVENATCDIIVFIDGDGTYDVSNLPFFINKLDEYDVCVGSHNLKKDGAYSDIVMWTDHVFFPFILKGISNRFNTSEPLTGFRVMKKETWYRLQLDTTDFGIELEMELKMSINKMKILEFPIPCIPRIGGKSKFKTSFKTLYSMAKFVHRHRKKFKDTKVEIFNI